MYGRDAVLEELAALPDCPVNAGLVGFLGGLRLLHQADERLRDVDVERARQQVYLPLFAAKGKKYGFYFMEIVPEFDRYINNTTNMGRNA